MAPATTAELEVVHEPRIAIESARPTILLPFHTFLVVSVRFELCFGAIDYSDTEHRLILCTRRQGTIPRGIHPKIPLIFDVHGQIWRRKCYLTGSGYPWPAEHPLSEFEPLASCWIEARPNIASRTNWRAMEESVQLLLDTIPGDVDTSHFTALDRNTGARRIQVLWQGSPDDELSELVPMYDEFGNHSPPLTQQDVPFADAVHVHFTIEYYSNKETDDPRIVLATMLRITKA